MTALLRACGQFWSFLLALAKRKKFDCTKLLVQKVRAPKQGHHHGRRYDVSTSRVLTHEIQNADVLVTHDRITTKEIMK